MATGKVKWFDPVKGFGFIEPSDGSKDAFVHISAVQRAGLAGLNEGQEVEYELIPDQRDRWIPSRSATVSSKPDLNVFSKLGKHGLDGCFEGEAFSRG